MLEMVILEMMGKELDISGNVEEKEYYDSYVIPLFENFFRIKIEGKYFYSRNTYGFIVRNPKVISFMHSLGFAYGNKSLTVGFPSFLKNEFKLQIPFLRGYFDTDGHLGFGKKYGSYLEFKKTRHCYPRFMFTTVSKNLTNDLKGLFVDLDMAFVYYVYQPKRKSENLRHRFDLNGSEKLHKWMSVVGMNNPTKLSRFLIWQKHGFCPTNSSYEQRRKILKGELNPNSLYGPMM